MIKQFDIYYDDLNDVAKAEFDKRFGEPYNFNHSICPLAIYEQEVDDDEEIN